MNQDSAKSVQFLKSIIPLQPFGNLLNCSSICSSSQSFSQELFPTFLTEALLNTRNLHKKEIPINIPNFPKLHDEGACNIALGRNMLEESNIQFSNFNQLKKNMHQNKVNNVCFSENLGKHNIEQPDGFEYLQSNFNNKQDLENLGHSELSINSKKISKPSFTSHFHSEVKKQKILTPLKNTSVEDHYRKLYHKLRSKRNPWKPIEDIKLLELVETYGESWAMISSKLEGRTGKQVRDRYLNILRPNLKKGEWSPQEDTILLTLYYQIGHKWSLIAKHMPGRSEAQVKNRFYSHVKKKILLDQPNEANLQDLESSNLINQSFDALENEEDTEESKHDICEEKQKEYQLKIEENQENKKKVKIESLDPKVETEFQKMEESQGQSQGWEEEKNQQNISLRKNADQYINEEGQKGYSRLLNSLQESGQTRERMIICGEEMQNDKTELVKVNKINFTEQKRNKPINEKEVDMVLEILARYFEGEQTEERIETGEMNISNIEIQDVNKADRFRQLDKRRQKLEFLLNRTLEEMEQLKSKI